MNKQSKYIPPQPSTDDTAHLVATAILSTIPGAAELFEHFIMPPLEKRRELWMEKVSEALRNLEANYGFNLDHLQSNERFITIVVQATTIAVRNHQKEKIKALQNALINSATNPDIGDDLQLLFIRYIEELTPSHLKMLSFYIEHLAELPMLKSYPDLYKRFSFWKTLNSIPSTPPAEWSPDKTSQDEFRMFCQDLSARGLIRISPDIDDFEDIYQADLWLRESTNQSLPRVIVTDIAIQFMEFITTDS